MKLHIFIFFLIGLLIGSSLSATAAWPAPKTSSSSGKKALGTICPTLHSWKDMI